MALQLAGAPAQQKQSRTPTIQVQTELVMVPVIARHDGKHAGGLKQQDFTLLSDGKPQAIAVFEEVHAVAPVKPAQAEEFTNQTASNAGGGTRAEKLTIIAIDLVNTAPLDQAYLRDEVLKFLDATAQTGEPFGLVAITRSGIRVMHDFTTDPKLLAAVVKQQPLAQAAKEAAGGTVLDMTPCARSVTGCGGSRAEVVDAGMKQLEAWNTMMTNQERFEIFRDRSTGLDTLAALQQMAQALRGLPGRKTLVWASSGVQIFGGMNRMFGTGLKDLRGAGTANLAGVAEMIDQNMYTFFLLSLANIAVYPLDARHGSNPSFDNFEPKLSDAPLSEAMEVTRSKNKEIIDNFLQIAAVTGGKPCFNRTDLANCLKEAVEDSKDYYLLGFYPDKQTKLGWHSISVKLNGPKADLQYRNGFLATALDPERIKPTDLQLAMLSPLDYTAVPFRGRFVGSTETGGKKAIGFALDLPPEAVSPSEENNHLTLDIVVVVRGTAGKEITRLAQRIDRELTPEQAAVIRTQGIHYTNKLELPAGEYGVWFVVRDSLRGKTGSVVTTVNVK
jgi:VWFA-related protein